MDVIATDGIDAESIENFFLGNVVDKPLQENCAVNVIYFTNKCNLACTYCYEDLAKRPPQILNRQDIRDHVDAIIEREGPDQQTLIVLFGGEPTLEWENAKYLMEYAYSKKKNLHFNMTTNGIKFLSQNFIDEFKSNRFYRKGLMSIDISFDGVGNQERIFHNGESSTMSMLKVFAKLNENKVRYRIRYTIQKSNVRYLYEDITKIVSTFGPERLITSVAWDTLSNDDVRHLERVKDKLREDWINRTITTSVCEFFCDMCNGCGTKKELKTYFTDEGNVTTYENNKIVPKFHDFKEKVE